MHELCCGHLWLLGGRNRLLELPDGHLYCCFGLDCVHQLRRGHLPIGHTIDFMCGLLLGQVPELDRHDELHELSRGRLLCELRSNGIGRMCRRLLLRG